VTPDLTAYGGYSEANRARHRADRLRRSGAAVQPRQFLVSDPRSSRSSRAQLGGGCAAASPWRASGKRRVENNNVGLFRTDKPGRHHQMSPARSPAAASFQNVGKNAAAGIEPGSANKSLTAGRSAPIYSLVDATFQSALTL